MNIIESYFLLLIDSVFGNIILYPSSEFIIFFMNEIGGYNPYMLYFIASTGFFIAILINYFFGVILKQIFFASTEEKQRQNYNIMLSIFQKYGTWIILFHIIEPFGGIVLALCGFARYNLKLTCVIALLSKMLYYGIYFIL